MYLAAEALRRNDLTLTCRARPTLADSSPEALLFVSLFVSLCVCYRVCC